ncbi:MAG: hypothetical protein HOP19_08155 [Acidobacteria bacterium]|nr:hypothetical protein [Acidobacteriota bacterium]
MKKLWFSLCLLIVVAQTVAQDVVFNDYLTRESGKYRVTLRLPADGLFAGEEQQLELRVRDASRVDAVLGVAAVIRARIEAEITMPAMAAMPAINEQAHSESVPGDYGLHPTFAHGGDYFLSLRIVPLADEPFIVSFPLAVTDEAPSRKARIKPFELTLKTEPQKVKAGEAFVLRLQVWANRETRDAYGFPSGKRVREPVTAFDTAHERKLHLMIVSRDFNFFAHEHPAPQSDGSFVLRDFVFPCAGEFQLFADVTPQNAGSQILSVTVKVAGKAACIKAEDASDLRVALAERQTLVAKKTQPLKVMLWDADGKAMDDLQLYLGALGHLMMIYADGKTFVHAHPDEREAMNGKGRLMFLVRPPKAGNYFAWVEVQREGRVRRVRLSVAVE